MRRLIWRTRLALILKLPPFSWPWRDAWSYADSIAASYYDDDPVAWRDPSAALDEDRTYWEAG